MKNVQNDPPRALIHSNGSNKLHLRNICIHLDPDLCFIMSCVLLNNQMWNVFCFQASRRYFVVTFLGSILWIGVFSYMMVWWAHQVCLRVYIQCDTCLLQSLGHLSKARLVSYWSKGWGEWQNMFSHMSVSRQICVMWMVMVSVDVSITGQA